jgi:hypothetical protein
MAARRYAVYFAPPASHPLWQAGCAWLGRDARAGQRPSPAATADVQRPWRYGFHATLKAPMALAPGEHEADWLHDVAALAARQQVFAMPCLRVVMLQDFLALRPAVALSASDPLRRLADACVTRLDARRVALTSGEHSRQWRAHFSERQREQLQHWAYAHVLDDWHFHMTLSGPLSGARPDQIEALRAAAERDFAKALHLPLWCDALCVFQEPAPGAPFSLTHRFPFGGAGQASAIESASAGG